MWNSIRECVERAIGASVPLGATPAELEGSDTVFHDLCECAQSAATAVGALGQTDDGAVAMVLAAAVKAAEPAVLHSAVLGAIEQWCREALAPQGPLVPAAAFPVAHSPAVATEWPHPRQQPAGEAAHAIEAFFGMAEGHPVLQATSQLRNHDGVSDIQLQFVAGSRMHVLVLHAEVVHGQPAIAVLLHESAASPPFGH
jgi:hypothetical protein